MSFEQLDLFFTSNDYEQFIAELEKFRPNFIDERYPDIVHDIVWQIDDIKRDYNKGDYQSLDVVARNLLGKETGIYRKVGKKPFISLKDAIAC